MNQRTHFPEYQMIICDIPGSVFSLLNFNKIIGRMRKEVLKNKSGKTMKHRAQEERTISDILNKAFLRSTFVQITIVIVACLFLFTYVQYVNCSYMTNLAIKLVDRHMAATIDSYMNIADGLGLASRLSSDESTDEVKKNMLDAITEEYSLNGAGVIYADGSGINSEIFKCADGLYESALNGVMAVGGPYTGSDGSVSIFVAAPLVKTENNTESIVGAAFIAFPLTELSGVVDEIGLKNDLYIFTVNKDSQIVFGYDSHEKEAGVFDSEKSIAKKTLSAMNDGNSGYGIAVQSGETYFYRYTGTSDTREYGICIGITFFNITLLSFVVAIIAVLSVGISIIRTSLSAKRVADNIADNFSEMSKSIKNVAETGFDSLKNVKRDNDAPIEYNMISDAMESIMERLDVATSDNREFLDSAVITDLIDGDLIKYIHGYYKNVFNVNVIIADSKGNVLINDNDKGIVDVNALRDDESASLVMLNDRVIGSVIFKMPENSVLDKSAAAEHAAYVAKILEMVADGNFRRSLQHRNKLRQLKDTGDRLSEIAAEASYISLDEAMNAEKLLGSREKIDYKKEYRHLMDTMYDIAARTEDIVAANEESSFQLQISEDEYDVREVFDDLQKKMLKLHEELNDRFNVYVNDDVPEKLYGDANAIKRIVENACASAYDENAQGNVAIHVSKDISGYATMLKIGISGNRRLSERDYKRVREFLEEDTESASATGYVGVNKLKAISFVRSVKRMNGTIESRRRFTGETEYTILIPQLEVEDDE